MGSQAPSEASFLRMVVRLGPVVAVGVGIAILFFSTRGLLAEGSSRWGAALVGGFLAVVFAFGAGYGTLKYGALPYFLIWRPVTRLGRRGRAVLAVLAAAAAGLALAAAGREIARTAIAVLPAALVLIFGGWACLLLDRRLRASAHLAVRALPDVLAMMTLGGFLIVLFDRDLLTTVPAAGALFPVGAWLSLRIWRAMRGARPLAVRAAADIVLSLLLGADLVLVIVWAANLFHLAPADVRALRAVLEHTGEAAELPWQFWLALYLALAAATLAFLVLAMRPGTGGRWARLRAGIRSVDTGRRLLTGVHIGLLVSVLIAMAAPAALSRSLRGPIEARYRVDLQRELDATGAEAAYEQIRRHFTGASPQLAAIVLRIHRVSPPPPGSRDATVTERHLARYVGQLQADAALLTSSPPPSRRLDLSPAQRGDLRERLDRLDGEQRRAEARAARAHQLGELAATVVAGTLQIPDVGRNEIIQIVREYLGGLVEGGRLRDVFAAWAQHVPIADSLSPERVVVPDPLRLRFAALRALAQRLLSHRARIFTAPTRQETPGESPADRAVDVANQVRYFDEGTGPCAGCSRRARPGEEFRPPGEHRIEPRIP
ncbi:MAG TPA: hypothetical protein VF069_28535 [Streptosporangiaceae bacterium]